MRNATFDEKSIETAARGAWADDSIMTSTAEKKELMVRCIWVYVCAWDSRKRASGGQLPFFLPHFMLALLKKSKLKDTRMTMAKKKQKKENNFKADIILMCMLEERKTTLLKISSRARMWNI